MLEKVKAATIFGCLQSKLTDFDFVSRAWKKNAEEERLLGVSLTGLRDNPILCTATPQAKALLRAMRQVCLDTAEEWSKALDMPMPAATTVVKPSGTVSALCGTASGLHPRHSPYYLRRVRVATTDPLGRMLKEQGVPCNPEVGKTWEDTPSFVFEFPQESPDTAVLRDDVNAIEQLNYYLALKKNWCEMNPSITVYVKEHEWITVADWVYKNWDYVGGVTFLPFSGGVYQLAPFEELTQEDYSARSAAFPTVDFSKLSTYEKEDTTQGSKEYACVGGACEVI